MVHSGVSAQELVPSTLQPASRLLLFRAALYFVHGLLDGELFFTSAGGSPVRMPRRRYKMLREMRAPTTKE